jgi:hypothetical protein
MFMTRTYETAAFEIEPEGYKKKEREFKDFCSGKWELTYLESRSIAILVKMKRKGKETTAMKEATELEKALQSLFPDQIGKLLWGLTLNDGRGTNVFPTGKIKILFKEGSSIDERKKVLSRLKQAKLQWQEAVVVSVPDIDSSRQFNEEYPEYVEWGRKKGITLPLITGPKKKRGKLQIPVAEVSLPGDQRNEAFDLAQEIGSDAVVSIATADFHALGKDIGFTPHQNVPPPTVGDNDVVMRNRIRRAWELFYPSSGPSAAGYPTRFLCSDINVAVIDSNFYDHVDIRYQWIGYDAADEDTDPRSPLEPPTVSTTSITYTHGTTMCGVIGGFAQTPGWECGVAPGTNLVPIRPFSADEIDLSTREGTDQFVAEYGNDWWNAMYRLFVLSNSSHNVSIANFSGVTSQLLAQVTNMDSWLNWFILNGNDGYGIFLACSAGNNPANNVAYPASLLYTFAVGWADFPSEELLGNSGFRLDITVDTGRFPDYALNDRVYHGAERGGGSSVSCAVVSGTAALMRMAGTSILNAEEIRRILRLTTRLSNSHNAAANEEGFNSNFGYGFLDAFHAVKIAYKDLMPAIQAVPIRFIAGDPPAILIHAGHPSYAWSFANQPSGVFWCLQEDADSQGVYWRHLRTNPNSRHCDIILDSTSPMGHLLAVSDFDGDGVDEIALQLGYWVDSPEHSFMVKKHNPANGRWQVLGINYGGAPGVQVEWPVDHPVSQVMAVELEGPGQSILVARQNQRLNAAKYDIADDRWKPFGEVNYLPLVSSQQLREAIGVGLGSFREKLLRISPFVRIGGLESLLVLGEASIKKSSWEGFGDWPGWPWDDLSTISYKLRKYLTASILLYNQSSGKYENVVLDQQGNTHIVLADYRTETLGDVVVDDFDGDSEPEAVIEIAGEGLIWFDTYRQSSGSPQIVGHSVYSSPISILVSRMSALHHGDVDGDGRAELAYLSQSNDGNCARFLSWNSITRMWESTLGSLHHGRKDNSAVDLAVGDFNGDGLAEVGMLMELPHRNTYRVFRMEGGSPKGPGRFKDYGLW